MIKKCIPGKLFIMGEYFIMEKEQKAIIAAVDRYLCVRIETSDAFLFESEYGNIENLEKITHSNLRLAQAALKTAYDFIEYCDQSKDYKVHITTDSNLLYEGKKIGLGSSAVIIVGILSAVLAHHEIEITPKQLFKLSVMVQMRTNNFSSGGDIAAAIYGGTIEYQRYDYEWLVRQEPEFSLLYKNWPLLEIKKIDINMSDFKVAWTQQENDTSAYLKEYYKFKKNNQEKFQSLSENAKEIVNEYIETKHLSSILAYRNLMLKLEQELKIDIETTELKNFIEYVNQAGGYAKVSGSGGGDCAIGFITDCSEFDLKNIKMIDIGVSKNEI